MSTSWLSPRLTAPTGGTERPSRPPQERREQQQSAYPIWRTVNINNKFNGSLCLDDISVSIYCSEEEESVPYWLMKTNLELKNKEGARTREKKTDVVDLVAVCQESYILSRFSEGEEQKMTAAGVNPFLPFPFCHSPFSLLGRGGRGSFDCAMQTVSPEAIWVDEKIRQGTSGLRRIN